ncbi:unnamed protein product [Peronospora destructor]|uniref:Reverse transcriptase domain-containing protein n=1 Tax=Peronospora destructor TaxID=86335 RepID=A0AAV0V1I1_9STRA|nr:unnamed protein product [Peronospora destructor]
MWRVLRHLGVESRFLNRCQDIYQDSAFVVSNATDGVTDPIRHGVGVYQGCPLSPLLFIAALVLLIRRLARLDDVGVPLAADVRPCTSAYADDIKVFCDSADGIQQCHGVVKRFLAWTGLRANPVKCACLAVTTGPRGSPLAPKIPQLKREAVALMQSGLAAWQVVKALKTYVYPKRGLRHLLRLPQSATTEFFYSPTSGGGLGLQSLVEMHQALQVAHTWQMLHSKDPAIVAVAKAQVCKVVRKRYRLLEDHWQGREDELVRMFLNSELAASPHATALRRSGDIASLWVDVQRVMSVCHIRLTDRADTEATDPFGLRLLHHGHWLEQNTVLWHVKLHMKLHMKLRHQTRWKGLADQGKTVRVHGGLGFKFIMSEAGLSDAEHRFGIQGRLNKVETNSVLKRRRLRTNHRCRTPGCSWAETLAHVLNHCAPNMDAIRQRHDDALEQIGAKVRHAIFRSKSGAELRLNQTVPEYTGAALRPDIVVRDMAAKTLAIADLTVTFEDQAPGARHSSLQLSYDHKILKYQPIAAELRQTGWRVQTAAIVYGALGSVQPSNIKTYTEALQLHKGEARQLELPLSSLCVRASHRIWRGHCRQHRERQGSGAASRATRGSGGPRSAHRRHGRDNKLVLMTDRALPR